MIAPPERMPERDAAILGMLPNVPFDGWTKRALRAGVRDAGLPARVRAVRNRGQGWPPGRRNGPFQSNLETQMNWVAHSAEARGDVSTHVEQRGGGF
jgi:hypothetical protein